MLDPARVPVFAEPQFDHQHQWKGILFETDTGNLSRHVRWGLNINRVLQHLSR
jgi:hypothetical protein